MGAVMCFFLLTCAPHDDIMVGCHANLAEQLETP